MTTQSRPQPGPQSDTRFITRVGAGGSGSAEDAAGASGQHDVALAAGMFAAAAEAARKGDPNALAEQRRQIALIRKRYWRVCYSSLSAAMARRRGQPEFSEDERLFIDLGLADARLLGGAEPDRDKKDLRGLGEEIRSKGLSGCFYLTEWLTEKLRQRQIGSDIDSMDAAEEDNAYSSQLGEARRRVLARLGEYFTALPGVSLEISEAVRSGDLAKAVIAAGITCLREPTRKNFLRRHRLWTLQEQILAKARARASSPSVLKLFDMLGEVYARDWRTRHDARIAEAEAEAAREAAASAAGPGRMRPQTSARTAADADAPGRESDSGRFMPASDPETDAILNEARQMRMRMTLMAAIDGNEEPDAVLAGRGPRVTKPALARFLTTAQTFDKTLAELPPVVIVPGSGRGFFAWESGCVMLALRPQIGVDDSAATALAWRHMLDDRFNRGGALRAAYEKRFSGASFRNDFPADYRAWLCRLPKGDAFAMQTGRRAFFHEFIGPPLTGPFLPPNLRSIAPQTMAVICRRLEKQVDEDGNDANARRRLAAIYWQQGETEAAGLQFNAAMRLAPDDGETLFSAGLFMRSRDEAEAANDCFKFGAERAAKTMWGVYCKDALAGLI